MEMSLRNDMMLPLLLLSHYLKSGSYIHFSGVKLRHELEVQKAT